MYNYHTHTVRCRHARGSEREFVEAAIECGFKELGFSDHAPYLFPKSAEYYSTFRMYPEQAEDYAGTVKQLKKEYDGRIKIYLGYEIEFYPEYFAETERYLKSFGCDYFILGQHFTYNEIDGIYVGGRSGHESCAQLEAYTDQVIEAMATGKFLYTAHPDVFFFSGNADFYELQARRLCRGSVKYGVPLEINLLGVRENRHYPNGTFWRIAGEEGATAVLGVDAHSPEAIRRAAEDERAAMELAKKFNIKVIERPEDLK